MVAAEVDVAQQPITRVYGGATTDEVEEAYRQDAVQAAQAGYLPVSQTWEHAGDTPALRVEYRAGSAPAGRDGQPAGSERSRADPPPPVSQRLASQRPASGRPAGRPSGRRSLMTMEVIDMHCAGEPLRLVRSGLPEIPSLPAAERRTWAADNIDHIRRVVIGEPRGHRDMYGAIVLPAHGQQADVAALFMTNSGWSTMCGHGIIALTVGLIEEGLHPQTRPVTTIRYEVPAGLVAANAATVATDGGAAVQAVRFTNVASYVAARDLALRPDGVELAGDAAERGELAVDISFGGAYYGIVDAADIGLRVVPEQAEALRRAGAAITDVLRRDHTPNHPTDASLAFIYGTIIVDHRPETSPDGRARGATMRNATIFADAELDRSPCGTGTSAILAQLHARSRLGVGQQIANAGITGEQFLGRIEAESSLGPHRAIIPSIQGTAYVTGYSTLVVDDRDPLGEGFLLG